MSRDFKQEENIININELAHVKYLISKNSEKKRIIVAFKGKQDLSDLMLDINVYPEFDFHETCINPTLTSFNRSVKFIPSEYLKKKVVFEEYNLILTGYGLRAGLALSFQLHLMKFRSRSKFKNFLFIGFGSPIFPDTDFFLSAKNYKNNFIFIKNENDLVIPIQEYLINKIYNQRHFDPETYQEIRPIPMEKRENEMIDFLNNILLKLNEKRDLKSECESFRDKVKDDKSLIKYSFINYNSYGKVFVIDEKNKLREKTFLYQF